MSKRSRKRSALGNPIRQKAGMETFDAARHAGFRGYFYFPNLEPAKALDSYTRTEIARKSVWLYENVGLAKSIINRTSRYEVGTGLWPIPKTADRVFNAQVKHRFHDQNKTAKFFDVAAGLDFYSGQVAMRRHIKLHGDYFAMLVKSPAATAMLRFIPGYTIGNSTQSSMDQSQWTDGVYRNPLGRPLQYRVNGAEGSFADVSSDYMLHMHDHFFSGQVRGAGILAHACRHLLSIDDVLRYASNGMKLEQQIGYVLTVPGEQTSGPRFSMPGTTGPTDVTNPDGSKYTVQQMFQGDGSVIPQLPDGVEIKVLESNRPGTNTLGFLDYLCRDICWGSDYAPEFLHNLGGIGGAPMRSILEDVEMTIDDKQQFQVISQYCDPVYRFWLYLEIASGRLQYTGDDLFAVHWQTPRKITVDKQREGRLDDSRLDTGKMSPERYHGQDGNDAEEEDAAVIDAYFRRQEMIDAAAKTHGRTASYDQIFRPPVGTVPPDQSASEEPADPPTPKK